MAETAVGSVGGVGGGIGGITGALQGTLSDFGGKVQAWVDRIFPPEKRNQFLGWISQFASERPLLASFLASQIALTGPALGLFMVMTISVAIFAILAGIILGLLGAVLFIVTCVGFGLVFLLPTLFVTIGIATFIWLWGMGTYYILKYFNEKPIPGIHQGLKEGLAEQSGLDGVNLDAISSGLGGDAAGAGEAEEAEGEKEETQEKGEKGENGAPKQSPRHAGSKGIGEKKYPNGALDHKKVGDTGKAVGGKAHGTVTGLKGAATGATGATGAVAA